MSLFDRLSDITDKKTPWENLTEAEQKEFGVFMINRFLSMGLDNIEIVNQLQKLTMSMPPREVYRLYLEIFPKKKQFNKYIKGKTADKYPEELVVIASKHFCTGLSQAEEYIDILSIIDKDFLAKMLKMYGKTDKEISKLLKK